MPTPRRGEAAEDATAALAAAELLFERGLYTEVVELLLARAKGGAAVIPAISLLARALANQGRNDEALEWCDCWIAADKLDFAAHYLRGVVLLEMSDVDGARHSLQRALYLQPEFVLAHYALGTLTRGRGQASEADRHFVNAQTLLARLGPDDLLPHSNGLAAGRLAATIAAATRPGDAR